MVLWAAIFFKICDDWIEKWWSACRMSTPQKWSSQISGLQCFHFTQLARNLHQGYTYKAAGTRYSKQPPCSGNKVCDLNLVFHVDATWQLQRRICKATRLCQFIWLQHRSWPDHLLAAALELYICKKQKTTLTTSFWNSGNLIQNPMFWIQYCTVSSCLKACLTKVVSQWGAAKSWYNGLIDIQQCKGIMRRTADWRARQFVEKEERQKMNCTRNEI